MSGVTLEIALILLLIMANGLFAMSEIAIVSSRKTRLEQRARQGDAKAGVALELANAPNRFLSTVQIGITLVGILAGAFGGATIAEQLAAYLRSFPRLAPFDEIISLAIVVLGITYFLRENFSRPQASAISSHRQRIRGSQRESETGLEVGPNRRFCAIGCSLRASCSSDFTQ